MRVPDDAIPWWIVPLRFKSHAHTLCLRPENACELFGSWCPHTGLPTHSCRGYRLRWKWRFPLPHCWPPLFRGEVGRIRRRRVVAARGSSSGWLSTVAMDLSRIGKSLLPRRTPRGADLCGGRSRSWSISRALTHLLPGPSTSGPRCRYRIMAPGTRWRIETLHGAGSASRHLAGGTVVHRRYRTVGEARAQMLSHDVPEASAEMPAQTEERDGQQTVLSLGPTPFRDATGGW